MEGKYFSPSAARICFLFSSLPFPLPFPTAFLLSVYITLVFTTGSKIKLLVSN